MKSLKSCFLTLAFVGGDGRGHGIRVGLKENEVGRGGGGGEVRYQNGKVVRGLAASNWEDKLRSKKTPEKPNNITVLVFKY